MDNVYFDIRNKLWCEKTYLEKKLEMTLDDMMSKQDAIMDILAENNYILSDEYKEIVNKMEEEVEELEKEIFELEALIKTERETKEK